MLYRSRNLFAWRRVAVLAALALFVVAPAALMGARPAAAAGTITVRAGDGEPGYAVNEFLPASVTIMQGDTVHFPFPWPEPHTITFGQPTGDPTIPSFPGQSTVTYNGTGFLTSGFIFGPEFNVQFTAFGTFPYSCVIHPGMAGAVTVLAPGDVEDVDTQFSADARGDAQLNSAMAQLKNVAASFGSGPASVTSRADGTKKYTFTVGAMSGSSDVQQFFPAEGSVKVGDTVEWKSAVITPHTITFGPPPPIQGDPTEVAAVAPTGAWDGTTPVHSGTIGVGWPGGTAFALTFGKTGTFDYYCLLHEPQSMVARVTVAAAPPAAPAPTPKPPATGTGLGSSGSDGLVAILLLSGLTAIVTGSAFLAARR